MACSSATLLDLSNELIHMVCRHLPFCDLMRLISTCRRIHDLLVTDSCLWKPLRFELILSDDQIANTSRINSLTQSRLISFCTRLRVVKLHKEQAGQCIPTIFFSKLLSVLAHQLTELCLLHLSNDYTINGHFTCSRYRIWIF